MSVDIGKPGHAERPAERREVLVLLRRQHVVHPPIQLQILRSDVYQGRADPLRDIRRGEHGTGEAMRGTSPVPCLTFRRPAAAWRGEPLPTSRLGAARG